MGGCSFFHIPPALDPRLERYYAECTTFCVVRHPASRLLSDFFFHRKMSYNFPRFVEELADRMKMEPYYWDCHLLPQVDFVFGSQRPSAFGASETHRYCQRVLKFEKLHTEFDTLMREFGLPVKLASRMSGASNSMRKTSKTNVTSFLLKKVSPKLQDTIRSLYAADFEAFGY